MKKNSEKSFGIILNIGRAERILSYRRGQPARLNTRGEQMNRTATTVSKTFLPAGIKDSMKAAGNRKNKAQIVVFSDDTRRVNAHDTYWDGGTHNAYFAFAIESEALYGIGPVEGQEMALNAGYALVVFPTFCGQDCIPTIYVRSADLAAFFGAPVPAEFPAEIAADYIDEQAETAKPRDAKRLRQAAQALRLLTKVGEFAIV